MSLVLPKPGVYVVAVSGGVDSMALLHLLHSQNREGQWRLVVAHLDHGIRDDAAEDRRLVQQTAQQYGLPFVYHEARLGRDASEATARTARYDFLRSVQQSSGAQAIITAHHQDDVLETALLNLLRGSGRKGLTSLKNRPDIERPLLHVPKQTLVAHATAKNLAWREDSTNSDTRYKRNYVRRNVLAKAQPEQRAQLIDIVTRMHGLNAEIDAELRQHLEKHIVDERLDRLWFILLPHAVAREVMAAWLRSRGIRSFDRKTLERLVVAAKVGQPGTNYDVLRGVRVTVWVDNLALNRYN